MSGTETGTPKFRMRMIKAINYMEIEVGRFGFGLAARLLQIASLSVAEHEYRRLRAQDDNTNSGIRDDA
jgi:hypothetical protein